MKMRKDRYNRVKTMIADFVNQSGRSKWSEYAGTVSCARFRWDLFWAACRDSSDGLGFDLYADGINDEHVDTVLRKVVVDLNLTKKGLV